MRRQRGLTAWTRRPPLGCFLVDGGDGGRYGQSGAIAGTGGGTGAVRYGQDGDGAAGDGVVGVGVLVGPVMADVTNPRGGGPGD